MVGYMSFSLKEDENDYMESASDCLVRLQKLWKLVLEHFIPLGLLEEDRDDSTYGPLWSFVTAIIGYGTDLYDATKYVVVSLFTCLYLRCLTGSGQG